RTADIEHSAGVVDPLARVVARKIGDQLRLAVATNQVMVMKPAESGWIGSIRVFSGGIKAPRFLWIVGLPGILRRPARLLNADQVRRLGIVVVDQPAQRED